MKLLALALALSIAVLGLAGCGNARSGSSAGNGTGGNNTLTGSGGGAVEVERVNPDTLAFPGFEYDEAKVRPHYPAASRFAGGSGTKSDPYLIENAEQLALLAKNVNERTEWVRDEEGNYDGYYALTSDIVVNDISDYENWDTNPPEYSWNAIGDGRGSNGYYSNFKGHFDGRGHSISGLYSYVYYDRNKEEKTSNYLEDNYLGLFGDIRDAVVENVKVDHVYFYLMGGSGGVGSIAAEADNSSILNCEGEGVIYSRQNSTTTHVGHVGGICGRAHDSEISDCSFEGTIQCVGEGFQSFGGIVGYAYSAPVRDCIHKGPVINNNGGPTGGIAGNYTKKALGSEEVPISMTNCVNEGDVSNTGMWGAGGIVGDLSLMLGEGLLTAENCKNYGDVVSGSYTGGIVGSLTTDAGKEKPQAISVIGCENYGSVDSLKDLYGVGGILSYANIDGNCVVEIKDCVNFARLEPTTEASVGGVLNIALIGRGADLNIEGCRNEGDIVCRGSFCGGVAATVSRTGTQEGDSGGNSVLSIKNCSNQATVTATTYQAGGVFGSLITGSSSLDEFIAEGLKCTGDLVLEVRGSISSAGGVIGAISSGNPKFRIKNCSFDGDIHINTPSDFTKEETDRAVKNIAANLSGKVGFLPNDFTGKVENCTSSARLFINGKEQ